MERSIAFYEAFLDVKPCSEVRLAGDTPPPVIIFSDAQVVPRERPGGGYLLADPLTGVRRGGWLVFDDELLEASQRSTVAIQEGEQLLACCECAMLPAVPLAEGPALRGRDVFWRVNDTADLVGVVEGASG